MNGVILLIFDILGVNVDTRSLGGDLSQWLETNFTKGKTSGIYINTVGVDISGTYNNYSALVTVIVGKYGMQFNVNIDFRIRKLYQNNNDPFMGSTWRVVS